MATGGKTGRRLSIPAVLAPGPRRLDPADRGPGKWRKGPQRSCKVASLEMGAWEAEEKQLAARPRLQSTLQSHRHSRIEEPRASHPMRLPPASPTTRALTVRSS